MKTKITKLGLSDDIKVRVERATVKLPQLVAQGVLVGGDKTMERYGHHFIVTAAHCVEYNLKGGLAMGDYCPQCICTATGAQLSLSPWVIEAVSDLAILGAMDDQEFAAEAEQFKEFSKNTTPISVCLDEYDVFTPFPVYVYTHKGTWVPGKAALCWPKGQSLVVDFGEQIEAGTSGGPLSMLRVS